MIATIAMIARVVSIWSQRSQSQRSQRSQEWFPYDRNDRNDRKSGFHMIVAIIWKPGLTVEALWADTPLSGQFYLRPLWLNPVRTLAHTNSVFTYSRKRPAPVADTFFVCFPRVSAYGNFHCINISWSYGKTSVRTNQSQRYSNSDRRSELQRTAT